MIIRRIVILVLLFLGFIATAICQSLLIKTGPYRPTNSSFSPYHCAEWFRDAKFGIWAHWGPQSVPRQGDWYARDMYIQGHSHYEYHLAHYGHPSKFGYKDIIQLWKAEKWDPEKLMALYKKAGARYFVSMGAHCDNFMLWNSKIHRWNSVQMGPHKDMVGLWQQAAKKQGMYFGVSEHLGYSYNWMQASHGADTSGPYKGVPYDGNDPRYQDLYHSKKTSNEHGWMTENRQWIREWFDDLKELVDTYHPDLLYSDSKFPYGQTGRNMLANFYNGNLAFNKGVSTAVYTCKEPSEGKWVQDIERGVQDSIISYPWQTDTSIGDWYYRTGQQYKSATDVIRLLVDVVSKNGNLLLNIVQTPEGEVEPDLVRTLNEIGNWMAVNGEGIYGSRPWKVYGERSINAEPMGTGQRKKYDENYQYTDQDIRFTTKGSDLYAFCLVSPEKQFVIRSLGALSKYNSGKIGSVTMLGSDPKLTWIQQDDALVIKKTTNMPQWKVTGFKIKFI